MQDPMLCSLPLSTWKNGHSAFETERLTKLLERFLWFGVMSFENLYLV